MKERLIFTGRRRATWKDVALACMTGLLMAVALFLAGFCAQIRENNHAAMSNRDMGVGKPHRDQPRLDQPSR